MGKAGTLTQGLIIAIVGGLAIVLWYVASQGVPSRDALQMHTGVVEWTRTYRGSIYFAMHGEERRFVYYSSGGDVDKVARALGRGINAQVSFKYSDQEHAEPVFMDGKFYPIYEISLDGLLVRGYEDILKSYELNHRVALIVGIFFLIYGIYKMAAHWGCRSMR